MDLILAQLQRIYTQTPKSVMDVMFEPLRASYTDADISNPWRASMYIAQLGVESLELTRMEENLNYSAEGLLKFFPTHFDQTSAQAYARNPAKIANHVYANRLGNGDELGGDGWRYRGRGGIDLTGARNYGLAGKALNLDLLGHPELASSPKYAFKVAAWFWRTNNLNAFADRSDLNGATKQINGGLNDIEMRKKYYDLACSTFGAFTTFSI